MKFLKVYPISLVLAMTLMSLEAAKKSKVPKLDKRGDTRTEEARITARVAEKVGKALRSSTYYGVFDNLAYSVSGSTVVLHGQVVRPTLKSEAQARVREIEGVDHVDNQIEVLPVSPFDDDIRRRAYRTIFSHPQMTKYGIQPVPPVHIIVKNGNLSLEGVVANEADKNVAGILANQVPNVFSVRNHLRISRD